MLGLGLLWLGLCAAILLRAQREARDAADQLRQVRDRGDFAAFLEDGGSDDLERAEAKFRHASSLLQSPLLAPLRIAPIAGRQIKSAHSISSSAAEAFDAGVDVLAVVRQTIGDGVPTGAGRVAALETVGRATETAAERIGKVDLGPTKGLIGSLVDARNEAASNLQEALDLVHDASLASRALTTLLGGPSDYVLLAANSAEMRAGSGMFLQIGALNFNQGAFQLGDMTTVTDVVVPAGAVPVTGDLADRWAFLNPTQEWRNLNASPRFDVTGAYAAQMWQAAQGTPAQGVIALDPFALEGILRATGAVTLDTGREISATNVVRFVLHDQYEGLDDDPDSVLRREQLQQIARAAVAALGTTELDPVLFVRELIDLVHGRHLLIWSQDALMQEAWTRVGAAGVLYGDSMAVSVLNRGTDKLDQYVEVDANLNVGEALNGRRPAELEVTVSNTTPDDDPRYIAGPRRDVAYGDYVGIVAVNLPGGATNARLDDVSPPLTVGADGPTRVIAGRFLAPKGTSVSVVVRFDLPADMDTIHLEPSARPIPLTWTVGDRYFADDRGHTVPLG